MCRGSQRVCGSYNSVTRETHTYKRHCCCQATTKHLYNICTTSAQPLWRWADVVQMLWKCFVFAGWRVRDQLAVWSASAACKSRQSVSSDADHSCNKTWRIEVSLPWRHCRPRRPAPRMRISPRKAGTYPGVCEIIGDGVIRVMETACVLREL